MLNQFPFPSNLMEGFIVILFHLGEFDKAVHFLLISSLFVLKVCLL